ncbi:MAG: ROK family transcriptional regulator [Rhodobacter sp.]|nr:ROK family transcriptional regulator [Rhodobacter sp.]
MDLESVISAPQGCGPLVTSPSGGTRPLRQQVFERVRAAGLSPRVDLARELGISPASVTALAAELIDAGFIEEVATPRRDNDTARGRPPVALGVRAQAGLVAGIKLSDHRHTAVVLDFAGEPVAEASFDAPAFQLDPSQLLTAAESVLDAALAQAGRDRADLGAVGLGLPGVVDHRTGRVHWSPLIQDRDVPLQRMLADRLGRPVVIDNDANLVTLAELWFGAGRELADFAVVTIEHGLGMGLVLNHHLYRGAEGLGLEIGHTKVQLDGALCRCGQRGCLEAYVADYALIREARTALNLGNRGVKSAQVLLESLYDHAKAGNQSARAIFHRAGRYLALGLANIVNLFDPSLILLSGERLRYDYLYAEEVLTEMQSMIVHTGRPPPKVEIHAWGGFIWARGAAALALEATTAAALAAEPVPA